MCDDCKYRYNRDGLQISNYNFKYDIDGYDKDGYNHMGYDRNGNSKYDKDNEKKPSLKGLYEFEKINKTIVLNYDSTKEQKLAKWYSGEGLELYVAGEKKDWRKRPSMMIYDKRLNAEDIETLESILETVSAEFDKDLKLDREPLTDDYLLDREPLVDDEKDKLIDECIKEAKEKDSFSCTRCGKVKFGFEFSKGTFIDGQYFCHKCHNRIGNFIEKAACKCSICGKNLKEGVYANGVYTNDKWFCHECHKKEEWVSDKKKCGQCGCQIANSEWCTFYGLDLCCKKCWDSLPVFNEDMNG